MKLNSLGKALTRAVAVSGLILSQNIGNAQPWKLIAISGQQSEDLRDAQNQFVHPDHTIFEVNLTTGAVTKIRTLPFSNDSVSIGFNPSNSLLYYTAGSESYSSNPLRPGHDQGGPDILGVGYQDSQAMTTVDLVTGAMQGIFNAAPCPNPDPTLPCFGLPAPRPTWVLPVEQRNSTQTTAEYRARGENEYHASRGMSWYAPSNAFYLSDENGIFTLSPAGESKFLAKPTFPTAGGADKAKGISFVVTTNLLIGHQDGVSGTGYIMTVNAKTGEALSDMALVYPEGGGAPVEGFGGLLGLAQHPGTGVLYGVRKTADNFERELVTINPLTGATKLVGSMGMHIASITFAQPTAGGPWKLIAISGQQSEDLRNAQNDFVHPDHTIFEVNLTDGSLTKIRTLPFSNDSVSIGFNPVDRLLYYTAGSESYSSNPLRPGHDQGGPDILGVGYQDSQAMIKVDLNTGTMSAVFNAAPCPNPDPTLPCFGLPAPRPTWVLPVEQRNSTQTTTEYRARASRGMSWYAPSNAFYLSDENGIFTLSPAGESKFLAKPTFPTAGGADKAKGIAFVVTTNLWVGHQDGVAATGYMMEVNPETGEAIRDVALVYPEGGGAPVEGFSGLLGLAQHPETGVLYGVRKTSDNFARELVTIDPATGATKLIGSLGMHIASITFAREAAPSGINLSATQGPGTVNLTWTGGSGKFLIQRSPDLGTNNVVTNWMNVLTTTERSATVVKDLGNGYFRIQDNYTGPDVIQLTAYLTVDAEKTTINGSPTGFGIATISLEGDTKVNYLVTYTGLSTNASGVGANNGHIHQQTGDSSTSGGVVSGFTPGPTGSSGYVIGQNTITTAVRDAILAGKTYVNIHTAVNGSGEIRGQILRTKYVATLNGANEVPPVTTTATGNAAIEFYGNEIRYNVSWNGLQGGNASAAHIHGRATTTESIGVLFGFAGVPNVATGSVSGVGIANTATRLAVVDGLSYVNVHTPNLNNGAGEIRGQLTPAP
jgi:hypothetical protein